MQNWDLHRTVQLYKGMDERGCKGWVSWQISVCVFVCVCACVCDCLWSPETSRWSISSFHVKVRVLAMELANGILIYISNKNQRYTVYYMWKLLYMFRMVPPPIIRSSCNCIYSIWYLSQRYCYLPLSWKSWNWFECAVGGVRHPQRSS